VKTIFLGPVRYGLQSARWNGEGECHRSVSGSLPPSGFKVALFTVTGKGYWKRCDRL